MENFIGFAQRQYWVLLENEIKGYIKYDADGYAMIDQKIMTIVEPENWRRNYQRVSTKIVRYFVESRPNSYKVYAGYVIQMLPYINHEWGILCDDIFEDEMDEIKTLSLYKLCHFAGYHWRRVPRFKDELSKLTFPINGVRERVFNFIPVGEDVGASQVMVNPRFVYSGNDRSTEKQLIKLFQYKED